MEERRKAGCIEGLYVYEKKGSGPTACQKVAITPACGMEGDWHGGDEKRQISLLSKEVRTWMEEQKEKGLCFEKFRENIRVSGLDLMGLREGDVLCAGEASLQVTGIFKKCHPEACHLAALGKECRLREQGIFARVLKGGELRMGEELSVCQTKEEKEDCHEGTAGD